MDVYTLTEKEFALYFDHTQLKASASDKDFEKLCSEAQSYGFKMVAINSSQVSLCKKFLSGSMVHVGAAISFPLGQTTIAVKEFETKDAIANGADEIDYVINISELKNGNWNYIEREMDTIVNICRKAGVISKVIFETCYLENSEIVHLAKSALKIRPDFIKTSTGFGSAGAKVEHIILMKQTVGNDVAVKAAGGIHTLTECREMILAGAERIGTSSSINIMKELLAEQK